MNESGLGQQARHFTSSAALPEPNRPPVHEGKPGFWWVVNPEPWKRMDDGTLMDAMADAVEMEKALRGE